MPIYVPVGGVNKSIVDLKVNVNGVHKNINHVFQKTANGDKTIWRRWAGVTYLRGPSVPSSVQGNAGALLLDDGRVLLVPCSFSTLGFYNFPANGLPPSAGNVGTHTTGIAHGSTASYAYSAAVKTPNGRVVLCPYDAGHVRMFNAAMTSELASVSHGVSGTYACAFTGGCYVEAQGTYPNRVVFTPHSSLQVRSYVVDANSTYSANTMIVGAIHGRGSEAFAGNGVRLLDGRIVFVPKMSPTIGIYNPETNVFTAGPSHGQSTSGFGAFGSGVLLPDGRVLLVPRSSTNIGIYNPATNTYTNGAAHGKGANAFNDAILIPESRTVILTPCRSATFGIYDIAANTYSDGPAHNESYGSGNYYWHGAVYAPSKQTIVLTPYGCNYIGLLKIN